jgi:hypothetical protein
MRVFFYISIPQHFVLCTEDHLEFKNFPACRCLSEFNTAVLWIRDILVRIRIRESVPQIWILILLRILLSSSVIFKMPIKNIFLMFFAFYLILRIWIQIHNTSVIWKKETLKKPLPALKQAHLKAAGVRKCGELELVYNY